MRSKKILVLATILLFCGGIAMIVLMSPKTPNVTNVTPGTDEYLRAYGLTDEQLSTATATEGRDAFPLVSGEGSVTDPIGDVLNRVGQSSAVQAAWADITSATLSKNEEAKSWDVRVTTADSIPESLSGKGQMYFYVDTDGLPKNNSEGTGVRAGVDAEFVIQYNADHGWYTDFRWYNKSANFWAQNKETQSTLLIEKNSFVLNIPFTEVSGEITPIWRVILAATESSDLQVDAAGIAGFPPPTGQTYPVIPLPPQK